MRRRLLLLVLRNISDLSLRQGDVLGVAPSALPPVVVSRQQDDGLVEALYLPPDYPRLLRELESGRLTPLNYGASFACHLLSRRPTPASLISS